MPRKKPLTDPEVRGAAMASQFAREIGLAAGNRWELPVARAIAADLREYESDSVETHWRARLGLK